MSSRTMVVGEQAMNMFDMQANLITPSSAGADLILNSDPLKTMFEDALKHIRQISNSNLMSIQQNITNIKLENAALQERNPEPK